MKLVSPCGNADTVGELSKQRTYAFYPAECKELTRLRPKSPTVSRVRENRFQISTEKRRGAISCAVPLIFSAWRKDAYRANWRYRAGGDRILLPEPRASACRRELRVGTDQRSCRHTRPRSEHERQRPGQTMRIVLVVQHEVARTSTAPYNEGSVRTFM
jgi:hypothetical protein